jgi:hypothetical protein
MLGIWRCFLIILHSAAVKRLVFWFSNSGKHAEPL